MAALPARLDDLGATQHDPDADARLQAGQELLNDGFSNLDPRLESFHEAITDRDVNNQEQSLHALQTSIPGLEEHYPQPDSAITDADAHDDSPVTGAQSTHGAVTASEDLGQPDDFASASLEDLLEYLQTFAKDHGFALVRSSLRRRDQDGKPTRLNLLCDRHGHLRNHRGLTDETRVRKKRTSRGVGCPYRIAVSLTKDTERPAQSPSQPLHFQPAETDQGASLDHDLNMQPVAPPTGAASETYRFKTSSELHNHAPAVASAHWKHRQLGPAEMKKIRAWYVEKKTPKDMLELLKHEDPGSLYVLKDVQNARAKARVQFLEYLEGHAPPSSPKSK